MSDTKPFEIDVVIRSHNQPDTTISRELVSDKASTDGVAADVTRVLTEAFGDKLRAVGDGD